MLLNWSTLDIPNIQMKIIFKGVDDIQPSASNELAYSMNGRCPSLTTTRKPTYTAT